MMLRKTHAICVEPLGGSPSGGTQWPAHKCHFYGARRGRITGAPAPQTPRLILGAPVPQTRRWGAATPQTPILRAPARQPLQTPALSWGLRPP